MMNMNKVISYTTRTPRDDEVDGVDYYFVSKDEFVTYRQCGFFAEATKHGDNYYGIAKDDCKDNSIAVVNLDGVLQLMDCAGINLFVVYISLCEDERELRMKNRGDSEETIEKRRIDDFNAFIKDKPLLSEIADITMNGAAYIDAEEFLAIDIMLGYEKFMESNK
jgi:guanylate kinase